MPTAFLQTQWIRLAGIGVTVLLFIVFANAFLQNERDPQFDQRLFVTRVYTAETFPPFHYGISSFLISGIYNRLAEPDPITADTMIKIGSTALFLLGALLLFTRVRQPNNPALAIICLLLVISTRFPFGWLSTEVLAGGWLMLALWSYRRGLPLPITAIFWAGFAFAKPDLFFPAALVAAYIAYRHSDLWRGRAIAGATFGVVFGAFLMPALIQNGWDSGRSLLSLHQHHAVATERHQIVEPVPDPWAETGAYIPAVWGNYDNITDTILNNPRVYYDFLWLSVGNTLYNIVASGVWLLIPPWLYCLYHTRDRDLWIITALLLTGLIPITLFSFMHTRYLTRFYPVLVWAIYAYATQAETPRRADKPLLAYLVAVLIFQVVVLRPVVASALWNQTTEL